MTADKIYYVTPAGDGDGMSWDSSASFASALSSVNAGEMILLAPGTYAIPYTGSDNTITLSRSGTDALPIYLVGANCAKAVFDFSTPATEYVDGGYGFYLTGDHWYLKNIAVTRAGYQGIYITGSYNIIENSAFYDNRNTGLEINKGGAHNTVINVDAYRNYNTKIKQCNGVDAKGSMADGFAAKQSQGSGNRFIGSRAWENSDDGFDTYDSPFPVVIERSWAFRNGVDVWGDEVWQGATYCGNGNGFKLGGNGELQRNTIAHSIAFDNPAVGFDLNGNVGGLKVWNNLAFGNYLNFGLDNALAVGEAHHLRNNVSLNGSDVVQHADAANNSWDSNATANADDFVSLDVSRAADARNPDGSLPDNGLFRLASDSDLIDAGVDVGLPFKGAAPDLGPFERQ